MLRRKIGTEIRTGLGSMRSMLGIGSGRVVAGVVPAIVIGAAGLAVNASAQVQVQPSGVPAVPPVVQSAIDTRLADAAMKRDTATVRALVQQKADVNAPGRDGTPPLHWLVRVDDLDTARLLLSAGADAGRPNRYGVRPLSLACANGNAAMIRVLLDAGADPNAPDQAGETPLMTAARIANADAVTALLDKGALIDARDPEFQQTALMIAVREDHPGLVKLFVDRHADIT